MRVAAISKLRNGLPIEYRHKLGLTQVAAAELAGVTGNTWCSIECMKFKHVSWEDIVKVAALLEVQISAICPDELKTTNGAPAVTVFRDIEPAQLLRLTAGGSMLLPDPAKEVQNRELAEKFELMLRTLSYREREIIKLRYGIGDGYTYTLDEVAKIFKVGRERVRQVEAKAIRKLQHPVRAGQLAGFLEYSR